ncbi:MAG: flavodoxin family protein [Promethearchaeota archaeon]
MSYMISMVDAVVLYNSRGGNTRKVALKIAEGLGCEVFDKKNVPKDLSKYDLIAIGSWMMAGMLTGKKMFKNVAKKYSGKIVLFFTSGSPDGVNEMVKAEDGADPILLKDTMWEKMEGALSGNPNLTILKERFYTKGGLRLNKSKPPKVDAGYPTEDALAQAKAFGEKLKKIF